MSEVTKQEEVVTGETKKEVEQLRKVLTNIAYLHDKLVSQCTYLPEEFKQAEEALTWMVEFANKIDTQILDKDPELRKKVEEREAAVKKAKEEANEQKESK